MKKFALGLIGIFYLCLSITPIVWAAEPPEPPYEGEINLRPGGAFNGLENITVPAIVPVVVRLVLIAAALVALVFLIIGGIKWITSGGDKTAVESARSTITSALIGLVVVFAAWAIIRLIELFFGIRILSLDIPSIQRSIYEI